MSEKACVKCQIITNKKKCPICGGDEFTDKYLGVAIVFDTDSEIAKELEADRKGKYALKLRK